MWLGSKLLILMIIEMRKIKEVLSMDVTKFSNSDAKSTFFQLLSLPLQSICRLAKDPDSALP